LDDFEAGLPAGWVLNGPGSTALAGNWTVGDPDGTNTEGDFVQPEDAFSGSGCVFTASNASLQEGDVDAGTTWLVSPLYDLSGLDNAKLRYARWYYNGTPADDAGDFFVAEVSDDGGASWNTIELLDDFTSAAQWADVGFELAPLIALTDQVRVRFGVADGVATDDLIEAAVDRVQLSTCTDCNSNGVDDGQDLALGVSTDFNTNGIPDDCEADGDPLRGGQLYDDWPAISQSFIPTEDHPLWAFRPDTSSNDASGLATWLCAECHGWDYRGVDGAFGSGPQRTGFPGIFGTTLDSAELFTLLAESPSNGGRAGRAQRARSRRIHAVAGHSRPGCVRSHRPGRYHPAHRWRGAVHRRPGGRRGDIRAGCGRAFVRDLPRAARHQHQLSGRWRIPAGWATSPPTTLGVFCIRSASGQPVPPCPTTSPAARPSRWRRWVPTSSRTSRRNVSSTASATTDGRATGWRPAGQPAANRACSPAATWAATRIATSTWPTSRSSNAVTQATSAAARRSTRRVAIAWTTTATATWIPPTTRNFLARISGADVPAAGCALP
jgi:hypothetical protein